MTRGRSLSSRNPPGPPGQRLKALREALGISGRDVQTHSRLIARSQGNQRYCISHSSLVEIENSDRVPSVHKLFTLSALYRINFVDLLLFFGIDLDQINTARLAVKLPRTHLVPSEIYDTERRVSFPVRFDPGENEFERPIYFFQLRDGYAYGWCELEGKVLSIIPHSMSGRKTRQFNYPDDIDVVGRVVAVAMPLRRKPARSSLPAADTKRIQ